ncbi:MAG: phosphodiester glycosidase family protein [Oscillospiraceae bacterium]|nr:phosphodiester glycosidase family protein [Oscillospiraceae bacterium]
MMFLICVAAVVLFAALAIKLKKARVPMVILTILALLPTVVLGLLTAGLGDVLNYPGQPQAAVMGLFETLSDDYVFGTLGLNAEEISDDAQALLEVMADCYECVLPDECIVEEFQGIQTVELTHLDTDGWLMALAAEAESVLHTIVQENRRAEVFNDDGTDYLDGITEQAYDTAFESMLDRAEEYLVTDTVELNLAWTPFGWLVVMDKALVKTLEGYDLGDEEIDIANAEIAARLSARLETERAEIVENLPFIEKVYTIAEDALMGCEPDPAAFGSTTDPNEVLAVIEKAENLIDGRTLSWSPDIEIKEGSTINYYYDESILVIQWKEFRNWSLATFAEVIVKDGSQIRRCIAGDEYRSFAWETPTEMSQRTNAVLGMSGDFYMFRAVGIMVYQGQVYRSDPVSLHHLFFTRSGDMLMTKSYEIAEENVEAFVEENDVSFSLAFGPCIIENGEKLALPNYLVGEFYDDYPRAAIGEVDDLHFILMTVGKEGPRENQTVTLPEAVQYIYEKGVQKAYALDGGKTANMTFNGELTNDPRYREERTMSDMIYFASAIPEDER